MAKKRRPLEYEDPVTKVELTNRLGGSAGRRLRTRIKQSSQVSYEIESQALIEQATGFLAEARQLSIDEARDALIETAATLGCTLREASEHLLRHEPEPGGEAGWE